MKLNKTFINLIKRAGAFEKLPQSMQKLIIASQGKIDAANFIIDPNVQRSISQSNEIGRRWFKDGKLMIKKSTPKTKIQDKDSFLKSVQGTETNFVGIDPKNIGGIYDQPTHTVLLKYDPNTNFQNLISNSFHEHLHGFGYGPSEVTKWKLGFLIDPNRIEKLSDRAKGYYLSDIEAPVHLAQLGRYQYGIKPGQPYIGDEAFKKLLEEKGISGSAYFMKRDTPKELRRLWRALNGTFFKYGGNINYNNYEKFNKIT